jgi:hypothetical protein
LDDQGLSLENTTDDSVVENLEVCAQETLGSIWDTFLQFYPNYGYQTHADAKFDLLKELPMLANKESDLAYVHYPILALNIQISEDPVDEAEEENDETEVPSTGRRPRSNSASSAASEGLKKRKSSQIWIN